MLALPDLNLHYVVALVFGIYAVLIFVDKFLLDHGVALIVLTKQVM